MQPARDRLAAAFATAAAVRCDVRPEHMHGDDGHGRARPRVLPGMRRPDDVQPGCRGLASAIASVAAFTSVSGWVRPDTLPGLRPRFDYVQRMSRDVRLQSVRLGLPAMPTGLRREQLLSDHCKRRAVDRVLQLLDRGIVQPDC